MDVGEHIHYIILRLKSKNGPRLLPGHLVIPKVLKVLDFDRNLVARQLLNPFLDHIADGTNRVVVGDNIEDAADALVGLDGTKVASNRVSDVEEGPPDRGVVDGDLSVGHCTLVHRVDD